MPAYYNEFDPKVAAWLRELIKQGLIADGVVDERSIKEVQPHDLKGFEQVHFFAGIGGWSYALRLAGVPDAAPVWTGSCPCQPFSTAGRKRGQADDRHLWPTMFELIRQCRPELVFGEQVASAVGHGWLDGVCADLDSENYTCGSVVLGAHSVGAPHGRQRLYWVAESPSGRERRDREEIQGAAGGCGRFGGVADAGGPQPGGLSGLRRQATVEAWGGREAGGFAAIACRDGKKRRIEPGSFPLAHGVPARVVRLRGYGNAIVPQVAAEFVAAFLDISGADNG